MERPIQYTDDEGNIYQLVKAPKYEKGDPSCRGCTVRAQSQIPGGRFCSSLGRFKCQSIPGDHVWYQIKWGAYPNEPILTAPSFI